MANKTDKHPMATYLSTYGEGAATVNGYTVQIRHDEIAENPRKVFDPAGKNTSVFDPAGTLVFFNNPYSHRNDYTHLSDEHKTNTRKDWTRFDMLAEVCQYNQYEEDEKMGQEMPEEWHWMLMLARLHANYVVVGVDMRDYGGGNMRIYTSTPTTPEEWEDNSIDGFIYKYVGREMMDTLGDDVERMLKCEIEEFEHWITGSTWGFTIEKEGEDIDSCWGFYGDHDKSGLFDNIMHTVAPLTTTTDSEDITVNKWEVQK
jgi:hypothetical protein